MRNHKIDATLTDTEVQEIVAAIDTIQKRLPFLMGLTTEERRELVKIGHKSQPFVERTLHAAAKHRTLLPGFLDLDAASRDIQLYEALEPILQSISELQLLIEDTQRIAGSEAYAAARMAYQSIKNNGKGIGLDDVIDDLSRQFRRIRRPGSQEAAS